MTVELIPNCEHCHELGVCNKTFFTMINQSGMADVIGKQTTNDPITADNATAIKLRDILEKWNPPEDWSNGIKSQKMKEYFIEFFGRCDGFTTH